MLREPIDADMFNLLASFRMLFIELAFLNFFKNPNKQIVAFLRHKKKIIA